MKHKRLLSALLLSVFLLAGCNDKGIHVEITETEPAETEETRYVTDTSKNTVVLSDAAITASTASGIYTPEEAPTHITLTSPNPQYIIKYTSSTAKSPDIKSDDASGEIRLAYKESGDGVTEFALIRAALFYKGKQIGQPVTFTYLKAPEGRFTMPVICLTSDPVGLYGHEDGILVEGQDREQALKHGNPPGWVLSNTHANYYNGGIAWERAMSMEYCEAGAGEFSYVSNGGMRVNGGWTRANIQKSLKLFSRKTYTPDYGTFAVDLFPGYRDPQTGRTLSFANTILLRGGSNNEGSTVISTMLQLKLCEGTGQFVPAMRPVVEFINGQYRGMFFMVEDYDSDFVESHFGVPEEDQFLAAGSYENYGGSMWTLDTGTQQDFMEFTAILEKLSNMDMRKAENYEYASTVLDLQNFLEYMCVEMYVCNSDWPDNNLRVFRCKANGFDPDAEGIEDGRYRFLLKDLDIAFGTGGHSVSSNPYVQIRGGSKLKIREIFNQLMKNEDFSERVHIFMCTLASGAFAPERVENVLNEFILFLTDEMEYTTEKLRVGGKSLAAWNNNLKAPLSFAKSRDDVVLNATQTAARNKLCRITITVTGEGEAKLGWYPITDGCSRTYITHTDIPLEIPAGAVVTVEGGEAVDGAVRFTKTEAHLTIDMTGVSDEAETADTVVINEVSVRGYDYKFVELYNGSDKAVTLDNWTLATEKSVQYLDGMTVESGGYLLLGSEEVPLDVKLTNESVLTLSDGSTAVDTADLFTVNRTVHQGRYPDGGELITLYTSELTPGTANAILPDFRITGGITDGLLLSGKLYPAENLPKDENGEIMVPLSALEEYFGKKKVVYRKEYNWMMENYDLQVPLKEFADFINNNTRLQASYVENANVVVMP
ncbi:MAG: CotH kinase family protein [Clostridia bacterium]|nr:CotH kinase family protein [Clostridia bacterium]